MFPNAKIVGPFGYHPRHFYRNRGFNGEVNLYRVNSDVISPTGRFCCQVPDDTNIIHTLCVNVGEYVQ